MTFMDTSDLSTIHPHTPSHPLRRHCNVTCQHWRWQQRYMAERKDEKYPIVPYFCYHQNVIWSSDVIIVYKRIKTSKHKMHIGDCQNYSFGTWWVTTCCNKILRKCNMIPHWMAIDKSKHHTRGIVLSRAWQTNKQTLMLTNHNNNCIWHAQLSLISYDKCGCWIFYRQTAWLRKTGISLKCDSHW